MFTGLIQGLGVVEAARFVSGQGRFRIRPLFVWDKLVDGESIAVNGVCLSVERREGDQFWAYASRETLDRTTLDRSAPGAPVNLERALAFGERLGGHLVTGHVDCLATVDFVREEGESRRIRCSFPERYAVEVLEKGSVALDGVSLTVNARGENFLEVNVIPETAKRTNIGDWRAGTILNMETDLLGKYVINYMRRERAATGGISREFLARNGFI